MGRKKTIEKEPVTIRFKELANGNQSIYLDIYQDGKRKYEFLKLYLVPEKGRDRTEARRKNAETMAVVNVIKAQRVLDIKNGMAGLETNRSKMKLFEVIDIFAEKKKKSTISDSDPNGILKILKKHLLLYKGEQVQMKDIDKDFCKGFMQYLRNYRMRRQSNEHLHINSCIVYYKCLCKVLKVAVEEGIIKHNPAQDIPNDDLPKGIETEREFLSIDEVKKLAETECRFPLVKNAFLFSCFCGLRISDIRKLRWSQIETYTEDGEEKHRLTLRMTKTKKNITYQLSKEAIKWLPDKGEDDVIFKGLVQQSCLCYTIKDWVEAAGIKKKITFHCARHTFATMMLTLGADIYTTSKLLGHSDIATTEIYAKIIDKKKDEAVGLIDKFFDKN